MNLDQLRYICAIYETGSIRRAADKLFLSQPNLSSAVSRLENELGYTILLRSHRGVQFTDRGLSLVQHAAHVLEECNSIRSLRTQPLLRHFHVTSMYYPPVDRAFIALCAQIEREGLIDEYDLRLTGAANWIDSLSALYRHEAELGVTCVPEETVRAASFRSSLEQHGVEFYPLAKTSVVAKLAKDHPLLREEPFPFEKLADYPMTEYSSRGDSLAAYGGIRLPFTLKASRIIVDSGRTRSQLIAGTLAWGIAMKLPRRHQEEYGIRYVEFPDSVWSVGCLRDPRRPVDEAEERFMNHLRRELSFLEE